MRDRIVRYLISSGKPLPAETILRDVLKIQSPNRLAAERLLRSILGRGSRALQDSEGRWFALLPETDAGGSFVLPIASIFLQTAKDPAGRPVARGALYDASNRSTICIPAGAIRSAEERDALRAALTRIEGCLLLAWRKREITDFNRALRSARLPEWQGKTLVLSRLASRLFPDIPARAGPDRIGDMLGLHIPDEDLPEQMAGFFARVFEALQPLAPSGQRESPEALEEWMESGELKIDFSRFAFGPAFLREIPTAPGVYLMRNRAGDLLYVGKARNLRRRVMSYFKPDRLREPKVASIHRQLHSLECVETVSEVEALILEMRMIRDFHPSINLQTEVHEQPADYGRPKNFVLLVPDIPKLKVRAYLFRNHSLVSQHSLSLGKSLPGRFREKARSCYFGSPAGARAPSRAWQKEIVARWFRANRRQVNFVDVDEAGDFDSLLRILSSYLNDPLQLTEKVVYR